MHNNTLRYKTIYEHGPGCPIYVTNYGPSSPMYKTHYKTIYEHGPGFPIYVTNYMVQVSSPMYITLYKTISQHDPGCPIHITNYDPSSPMYIITHSIKQFMNTVQVVLQNPFRNDFTIKTKLKNVVLYEIYSVFFEGGIILMSIDCIYVTNYGPSSPIYI